MACHYDKRIELFKAIPSAKITLPDSQMALRRRVGLIKMYTSIDGFMLLLNTLLLFFFFFFFGGGGLFFRSEN